MSHAQEPSSVPEDDLAPTQTAGYKVGQQKTIDELAQLDAEDESLARWKASLGIGAGAGAGAGPSSSSGSGPNVEILGLSLTAPTRAQPIQLDLTDSDKVKDLKKSPIVIKEGAEYNVELKFKVNHGLVSGLKYIQAVRRLGATVDKLESMIGSYGPSPEPVVKKFVTEEAPTGMLARSGTYAVRSRVIDDDGKVYVDFEWAFKLAKEW
ncbi:E set domain-containing protein [Rhodotorula diobovata]|uniref:Rho GDP-dissociation inhibitor n=1 Tax=Rhodotorula diobovata TaxID=5288 RepID=A0A5C5G371_9BASI|nr:E set domain-containing protein [Rhodotorula diobovata]